MHCHAQESCIHSHSRTLPPVEIAGARAPNCQAHCLEKAVSRGSWTARGWCWSRDGVTKIGGNPGRSQGARAKSSISFRWCCCAFRAGLSWGKRSKDPKTSEKPKSFINRPTIGVNTVNMKLTHPPIPKKKSTNGRLLLITRRHWGIWRRRCRLSPYSPFPGDTHSIPFRFPSDGWHSSKFRPKRFPIFPCFFDYSVSTCLDCPFLLERSGPEFPEKSWKILSILHLCDSKPPGFLVSKYQNYWTPPFFCLFLTPGIRNSARNAASASRCLLSLESSKVSVLQNVMELCM